MRRLILLRHAKSDWKGEMPDRERPLSERGRRDAPVMGAYLAEAGLVPDAVLCSPAQRTRETWDLVAPSLDATPEVYFEPRLYEADADAIVQVIRAAPMAATLLVVGHNPGMEDSAECLIGSAAEIAHAALRFKFPTAALAVLDFPIEDWRDLAVHSGRLVEFTTPEMLEQPPA